MSAVVHLAQPLETLTCWAHEGCGIQFAVPQEFLAALRAHQGTLHCPRGHLLGFGESELSKARKELEAERKRKEWAQQEAENERAWRRTAEKGAAIARGKLKAQSQRVKNGVCPCCNRTFQNLMRHMETKHPDFAEAGE